MNNEDVSVNHNDVQGNFYGVSHHQRGCEPFECIPEQKPIHNQNTVQSTHSTASTSSKRARTTYTSDQLIELERQFECNENPCRCKREQMANKLDVSEQQIQSWFHNRRMKIKKEMKGKTSSPSSTTSESPDSQRNSSYNTMRSRYHARVHHPYADYSPMNRQISVSQQIPYLPNGYNDWGREYGNSECIPEQQPIHNQDTVQSSHSTASTSSKRAKTTYTSDQLIELERQFECNENPCRCKIEQMARKLELSEQGIKTWFRHRRMKSKRQMKGKTSSPSSTTSESPDSQHNSFINTIRSRYHARVHHPYAVYSPMNRQISVSQQIPYLLNGYNDWGREHGNSGMYSVNVPQTLNQLQPAPQYSVEHQSYSYIPNGQIPPVSYTVKEEKDPIPFNTD